MLLALEWRLINLSIEMKKFIMDKFVIIFEVIKAISGWFWLIFTELSIDFQTPRITTKSEHKMESTNTEAKLNQSSKLKLPKIELSANKLKYVSIRSILKNRTIWTISILLTRYAYLHKILLWLDNFIRLHFKNNGHPSQLKSRFDKFKANKKRKPSIHTR